MALIKCKCGIFEKNFKKLSQADLPEGWECEKCPEMDKKKEAPKKEAPQKEGPKKMEVKEEKSEEKKEESKRAFRKKRSKK